MLADFIRKECANDGRLQDRFLALGEGTFFQPTPETYKSRVLNLIEDYGGRDGYIEYNVSFDFNRAVWRILDEAADAMANQQWEVAIAVLSGVAAAAEEILYSGDDSAGELSGIVDACFLMWHQLCEEKSLPVHIKSEIFELALTRFNEGDLKDWNWWWDWMEMAIEFADTHERQTRIFKELDAISSNGDDWSAEYAAQTAQKYKLELMSKCATPEERRKFIYDNVANPDFRRLVLQMVGDGAGWWG